MHFLFKDGSSFFFCFQNAIANASSLAEVERLKGMLQAGQIPGRDLRQGQCCRDTRLFDNSDENKLVRWDVVFQKSSSDGENQHCQLFGVSFCVTGIPTHAPSTESNSLSISG